MVEFRNRSLPVPVDNHSQATRLALILPDMERIATRAGQERALRLGNEQVIREALTYAPPFAKKIAQDLSETRALLSAHGFIPDREDNETGLDQAIAKELKEYRLRPGVVNRHETIMGIARRIARIIHPDTADPAVVDTFSESERDDIYRTSLKLANVEEVICAELSFKGWSKHLPVIDERAEDAQRLLIETMPRLYLHQIREMLARGMSFAEIVAQNPELVPEMENVRWIARIVLPDERFPKTSKHPKMVEARARDIREKKEHHARTTGYATIYEVAEDVIKFAKSRGLEPLGYANEHLLKFMEETGGYVGGTSEIVFQRGDWVVTHHSKTLAERMEEFIRALPHALHYLVEVIVAPDATPEVFNKALEELRGAVASVRSSAERYGQELVDTANRRNTPKISFSNDPSSSITSIYNKNY